MPEYIQFNEKTTLRNQVLKVVIGLLVVIILKEGIKLFTPDTHLFDYIRYSLIGLWVSAGAPYMFNRYLGGKINEG